MTKCGEWWPWQQSAGAGVSLSNLILRTTHFLPQASFSFLQPCASQAPLINLCNVSCGGKGALLFCTRAIAVQDRSFEKVSAILCWGACKRWRPGHMMFMISADRRSFSRRSFGFMGKLRSNFWGTAFVLWDYHNSGSSRDGTSKARPVTFVRFTEDMVDGVGQRKMTCVVRAPRNKPRGLVCPISQHGMNACFSPLAAKTFWRWSCISNMNNSFRSAHAPRGYQSLREDIGKSIMEEKAITRSDSPPMDNLQKKLKLSGVPGLLKKGEKVAMFTSKIPEWDVQRQCWSLDFKGRATLPSMHNFQLLLPEGTSRPLDVSSEDGESSDEARGDEDRREDSVVMQLGKIGKGLYALDYRYPLSAFQAFNIALSSFATTVGVEP